MKLRNSVETFGAYTPEAAKKESAISRTGGAKALSENFTDALMENMQRIKLWVFLQQNHPEAASLLTDQQQTQKAIDSLAKHADQDESPEAAWNEVKEALGIHERAQKEVDEISIADVIVSTGKFDRDDYKEELITLEKIENSFGDSNKDNLTADELVKADNFLKEVLSKAGPEEIREVAGGWGLSVVEDRLDQLRATMEIQKLYRQKEVVGSKTAVSRYKKIIEENGDKRVLQPRKGSKSEKEKLSEDIEKYKAAFIIAEDKDALEKAGKDKLVDGFKIANKMRGKINLIVDRTVSTKERRELYRAFVTTQRVYQDAIVGKLIGVYQKKGRSWGSREVEMAVEQYVRKQKKQWTAEVDMPTFDQLSEKVEREMELLRAKRGKSIPTMKPTQEATNWEPTVEEFEATKRRIAIEEEMRQVMGTTDKGDIYNIFTDPHFFLDLARGEAGEEEILKRAKPKNKAKFKEFLQKMRSSKEVDTSWIEATQGYDPRLRLEGGGREANAKWMSKISELLSKERYGEASSLMLEYITRIGIQESQQDWDFALVKRNFADAISKASPDFKEAFDLNMQLGWTPDMNSQTTDDFYKFAEQIFGKGRQELTLGDTSLFSGNVVKTENGEEVVFSLKTVKSLLRNPRYMLKMLKAAPNSTDSTLQNIMLEAMYGRGARMTELTKDGKKAMYLKMPGVDEKDWKLLSDVKVNMRYADIWAGGFKGWEEEGQDIPLSEMLQRNQWILRNALGLQWYSEEWKHLAASKSYQEAVLQAAPKSLLTSNMAKQAYQGNFENITPPLMRAAEVVTNVLGPMPVYKESNIIVQHLQDELQDVGVERGRGKEIGEMIADFYRQKVTVEVEGDKLDFFSRLRDPSMNHLLFNDWDENNAGIAQIVRERLEDMGVEGIPDQAEIVNLYNRFKALEGGSTETVKGDMKSKIRYFGQMYKGVWEEVKELKMANHSDLWGKLGERELRFLIEKNAKFSGREVNFDLFKNDKGDAVDVAKMKRYLLDNLIIESMMDPKQTKHGDDWQQYYKKYAPARDKYLDILYKSFMTLHGAKKDFVELDSNLAQFLTPQQRRDILSLIAHDLNRATSNQTALAPLEIPLTTSREHAHPWWKFFEHHDNKMRGTSEIVWDKWVDEKGRTYFAYDQYGNRTYQKEKYTGNWSEKEQGDDNWRPHDFEDIGQKLQENRLLDEHSKHVWLGRVMGKRKEGRAIASFIGRKVGLSEETINKIGDKIGGWSTQGWLLMTKFFLFDDPKYALFSFLHEASGMTGKTMQYIFGFDLLGGGSSKGH